VIAAPPPELLLLVPIGVIAGVVNTLAGGGSFLTLPALLALGLPADVANGTNRVAVVLQSGTASVALARAGRLSLPGTIGPLISALVGALLGAAFASALPVDLLRRSFGVVMLAMAVVLALKPRLVLEPRRRPAPAAVVHLSFLAVGAYGGFVQAGVGLWILLAFSRVVGRELVAANASKNLIVFAFTLVALGVFAARGQVEWTAGLVLASGNAVGGWLGARWSSHGRQSWILGLVVVVMVATGLRLVSGG
jgi:uncharacterized membrane protein YfcA